MVTLESSNHLRSQLLLTVIKTMIGHLFGKVFTVVFLNHHFSCDFFQMCTSNYGPSMRNVTFTEMLNEPLNMNEVIYLQTLNWLILNNLTHTFLAHQVLKVSYCDRSLSVRPSTIA